MPLNDAVTDGQPQTGAVHSLSRIERFEDALAHLFIHTGSAIGKAQLQTVAVLLAANRQTATLRHGVDGIDDEVHKDLTQL